MITYQVWFTDLSQVKYDRQAIEDLIDIFNNFLDKEYYRNRSIRISKYTLCVLTKEHQELMSMAN